MKATLKVLAVAGIALGLAFFFFKKPAQAETTATEGVSAGAGGIASVIVGGVKKILSAAKKFLAPAAAVGGAGVLAGGGAGFSAAAAGGNIVTSGGFLVSAPAAVPVTAGSAVPAAGFASIVGPALMLAAPFVLGPPLRKLIAPRMYGPWDDELYQKMLEESVYANPGISDAMRETLIGTKEETLGEFELFQG